MNTTGVQTDFQQRTEEPNDTPATARTAGHSLDLLLGAPVLR